MQLHVLKQTQFDRDTELAKYLCKDISYIKTLEIASPDSLRIARSKDDVLTNGRLDPAKVISLYKDLPYLNIHAYLRTLMLTAIKRRPQSLMFFVSRTSHNSTVLDYGCGVGSHALIAAQKGARTTILDVDGPMLDFAKWRFGIRNLDVKIAHSDTTLDTYSHIVCVETLEHVPNPTEVIQRLATLQTKGGLLFILVSSMIKDCSGHFKENIEQWQHTGKPALAQFYDKIDKYIYRRK